LPTQQSQQYNEIVNGRRNSLSEKEEKCCAVVRPMRDLSHHQQRPSSCAGNLASPCFSPIFRHPGMQFQRLQRVFQSSRLCRQHTRTSQQPEIGPQIARPSSSRHSDSAVTPLILISARIAQPTHGPTHVGMKPRSSHWLATRKAGLAAAVPGLVYSSGNA
jgi:hypothetical protein